MSNLRYKVNLDFWKSIDTQEKAYCLGFLCGDGGVRRKQGSDLWASWYVSSTDEDVIVKIKQCCGYTGPLLLDQQPGKKLVYKLQVVRRSMVEDLERIGLVTDKASMNWVGHLVPVELLSHFCRGLLDSDGSVSVLESKGGKKLAVTHSDGSELFVKGLAGTWENITGNSQQVHKFKGKVCWNLQESGSEALKLLDWMYKDATIYMNRKYAIYRLAKGISWLSRSEAQLKCSEQRWKNRRLNALEVCNG